MCTESFAMVIYCISIQMLLLVLTIWFREPFLRSEKTPEEPHFLVFFQTKIKTFFLL